MKIAFLIVLGLLGLGLLAVMEGRARRGIYGPLQEVGTFMSVVLLCAVLGGALGLLGF